MRKQLKSLWGISYTLPDGRENSLVLSAISYDNAFMKFVGIFNYVHDDFMISIINNYTRQCCNLKSKHKTIVDFDIKLKEYDFSVDGIAYGKLAPLRVTFTKLEGAFSVDDVLEYI